jgi:hypothetical protein
MKVAICTPHHGDVKAHYAFSLASMTAHTVRARPEIELRIFMVSSSLLPKSRTILAEQALGWGADWLLLVDADHLFPPDTLLRLLAHGVDAVGVNYPRRQAPGGPTASRMDGEGAWHPVYTTAAKAEARLLEEVSLFGTGLVLIKAEPVRRLGYPLFSIETLADGRSWMTEDMYFFGKLRDAGTRLHVDHGLSWEIGHVAERVLTNADIEQGSGG